METIESTEIAIVGAGPAGLALALSLAKFRIQVGTSQNFGVVLHPIKREI